jgi:hypothetical protein
MKEYYKIEASIDPKIIGRSELPLTVEIKDKRFLEYRKTNLTDIDKYFQIHNIYDQFPKEIVGKMYQRKKHPIDIMNIIPSSLSLKYVISERVKQILKELLIDDSEYHLEEIKIEGSTEKFYFFFIPYLKSWEVIDYSKTVFYDTLHEKELIFRNFESYEVGNKLNNYLIKELFISKKLKNRDIINIPVAGAFYSEKIMQVFKAKEIIGYDLITSGDFMVKLHFND